MITSHNGWRRGMATPDESKYARALRLQREKALKERRFRDSRLKMAEERERDPVGFLMRTARLSFAQAVEMLADEQAQKTRDDG